MNSGVIINNDCFKELPKMPSKLVNLVLTDLPYGKTKNKWDSEIDISALWEQYNRVLTPSGIVIMFAMEPFTSQLILSNKELFKYRLTWKKEQPTNFLNAKKQPLRQIEDICVFYDKNPTYNPQMRPGKPYKCTQTSTGTNYGESKRVETINNGERYPIDLLEFSRDRESYHPTQKPIALLRYLIRTYSNENDMILDNCMGSGSTCVASLLENRSFIGIEKDKKYFCIARNRIMDYNKQKHRFKITTL